MESAQQQLFPGDIVSPERRSDLGDRYYRATADVGTPNIRVKTVPLSITPPYRPLLTDGICRGRKAESRAGCAARMDPESSVGGHRGGDEARDSSLDIFLCDNGQYVQVFQRPDFRRLDVVVREPRPIMWDVRGAVVNVVAETPVAKVLDLSVSGFAAFFDIP